MFMLRSAGATLFVFAVFNAAFGLNAVAKGDRIGWLLSACLLLGAAVALVMARPWSRVAVYSAAIGAAVLGAVSQISTAAATNTDMTAATSV
ncbi:MAG TPA: hypothetical protein VGB49_07275, partial [Caulobacteraceae bacterium]